MKPGLSLGDTGTGMTMAITILGALFRRRHDRRGPPAAGGDAGRDAALHAHQFLDAGAQRQGSGARRDAFGRWQQRAVRAVSCAPGGPNDYVWIMTSRANPEHWARLCKVMGREELINDPRFATPAERVKNDAELDAIITEWTTPRTKHEAMEQVGGAGIPAGAVLDTMELKNDPTFERAASCSRCSIRACAIQDAGVAGAHRWQAATGEGVAGAGAAHR